MDRRAKFSSAWGTRDVPDTTLVQPAFGARRSAATPASTTAALLAPVPVRRLRLDATVDDVPLFGGGAAAEAGYLPQMAIPSA